MTDRQKIANKFLEKWEEIKQNRSKTPKVFVGFDGFTDEIIDVVEKRNSPDEYVPFQTISALGRKVTEAAGKSCNIELITKIKKLGGNAPILTNALLQGGHQITFCGLIGAEEIELLFQPMASQCKRVISLGPSAHSDALEFSDGKIMLGKHSSLKHVTYENIVEKVGKQDLITLFDQADLLVFANWTMLLDMTNIWKRMLKEIFPHIKKKKEEDHFRHLFIDLADPAKRSDEDLKEGMETLAKFQEYLRVIIGLNFSEATRIGKTIGVSEAEIESLASALRKKLNFFGVIIHSPHYAIYAVEDEVTKVEGPYFEKPVLTTGAGDNFNAGFCNGLLYGFSPHDTLLSGVATGGYYVSHGKSPSMAELAAFILEWEKNQEKWRPTTLVSRD